MPEPRPHSKKFDGEFLFHGQFDDFLVELFDTHKFQEPNHNQLGYRLWDKDEVIFEGSDLGSPRHEKMGSSIQIISLLGFLSLRDGDTDAEYFDSYTRRQLEWRDERAEDLGLWAYSLAEMHGDIPNYDSRRKSENPTWACDNFDCEHHDWVICSSCHTKFGEERYCM